MATIPADNVTNIAEARKPDWNKIRTMYEQGAGDPEVARELNISMRRFYELVENTPAFSEFVEMGRTLAMAWWYEKGRTGLFAEKFNTSLYNMNMKNRFGWADKVDTNTTGSEAPANADQLKSQLAVALKRLLKTNPELASGVNLLTVDKEAPNEE